jgi:hypothetical protein
MKSLDHDVVEIFDIALYAYREALDALKLRFDEPNILSMHPRAQELLKLRNTLPRQELIQKLREELRKKLQEKLEKLQEPNKRGKLQEIKKIERMLNDETTVGKEDQSLGDQNGATTLDVRINGFERPVPVFVTLDNERAPGGRIIPAPDTRHAEVFVSLDHGENYHGSLRDEFFVCRDNGYGPNWSTLWVTLNASQEEDSVQRLQPACLLGVGWQPDDLDEETESLIEDFDALELDGLILLWAYARYAATTWGAEFFAGTKVKAGVIKSEIARAVLHAAMKGEPLDLKRLYGAAGRSGEGVSS